MRQRIAFDVQALPRLFTNSGQLVRPAAAIRVSVCRQGLR
jgi:hypothetical protein